MGTDPPLCACGACSSQANAQHAHIDSDVAGAEGRRMWHKMAAILGLESDTLDDDSGGRFVRVVYTPDQQALDALDAKEEEEAEARRQRSYERQRYLEALAVPRKKPRPTGLDVQGSYGYIRPETAVRKQVLGEHPVLGEKFGGGPRSPNSLAPLKKKKLKKKRRKRGSSPRKSPRKKRQLKADKTRLKAARTYKTSGLPAGRRHVHIMLGVAVRPLNT